MITGIVYVKFRWYFDNEFHDRGAFIPVENTEKCFSEAIAVLEERYGQEIDSIGSMEYIDMDVDLAEDRAEQVWKLLKEEYDG